jgi:type III secretion system FlhB-like substrate exporter
MSDEENAKPKQVVGLKYDVGEGLPQVILKGSGKIADEMLRTRPLVNGPTVIENAELAQQLYRLPIDAEIGPELFHLVATLLAHVFAIEERLKRRMHA